MLKDNLKILRKNKGLSQEELSIKLHVVRQTISKWESGLSVPDAEMLMTISEIFETPVSEILGESIEEKEKKDPFKSLYTKARKTQHARIRYNIKNKPDYREDHYEPWKKAAEQARDYYKKQNDIDGFQKWIEDNKNAF